MRPLPVLTRPPVRPTSTAATTLAMGAVACGVCCALPFAAPAVALATSGGLIAFVARTFAWALYPAFAMVIGGWVWVALDSRRRGRRPARSTMLMLSLATVALSAALVWPVR